MVHTHHTLKQDLTRTLLLWSGLFFVFLGIVFLLSFNALQSYILDLMAEHRLQYQTAEFAKHLDENDDKSIREEGDALIQQPLISAILLIDASGRLMHASITPGEETRLSLSQPVTSSNLASLVGSLHHLKLYTRKIPGHNVSLTLIMDERPVTMAIVATTAWTALLILILVGLSILGLHRALEKRLVEPVHRIRASLENKEPEDRISLDRVEEDLPEEASEILDVYQHLKHAHDDLREHIVEMMQVLPACFWWSNDGEHYSGISAKSSQILKLPPAAIQGQKLWSWGPGDIVSLGNRNQLAEAIAQGREHLDFAYPIHENGDQRWFGESITICYDRKGKLDCIYGIINDISARKLQQQALSEQIQMAERMDTTATLVGGIAHEFNNALAGMQGNLYLIRQQATDTKTIERMDRIEKLIERSAEMIEQMLVFARRSQLRPETIDMARFMRDYELIVRPTMSQAIDFELDIGGGQDQPVTLFADSSKLQEALTHLLHNALAAVNGLPEPRIRLSMHAFNADEEFIRTHPKLASRRLIRIAMEDNGAGMSEEVRQHIFEPFFTTREVGQGTGLGLPMVYGYVRQLGGCIEVDSAPGKGSRIALYLPRKDEEIERADHSGEIVRGHGETILVVDDEDAFREAASEVLQGLGYKVLTAAAGSRAIDIFREQANDIALIVLDVVMPGLNGAQTATELRRIKADVPILYATAYDMTDTLNGMARLAHTGVIHKPFRVSALSQSVQKLLSQRAETPAD